MQPPKELPNRYNLMNFVNMFRMRNPQNQSEHESFSLPPFTDENMPPNIQLLLKDPDYRIQPEEIDAFARDFGKSPNNLTDDEKKLRRKYLNIIITITKKGTDYLKKVLNIPEYKFSGGIFNEVTGTIEEIKAPISSDKVKNEFNTLIEIIKSQENKKMTEIDIKQIEDQLNIVKSNGPREETAEIFKRFDELISILKRQKERGLSDLENLDSGVNTVKRIAESLLLEIDPPPCVIPHCNEKKYMTSTAILSIIVGIIGIITFIIIMMFFRNKR
jgi:ABC-type antimicrobial peptide transport system permease subunit